MIPNRKPRLTPWEKGFRSGVLWAIAELVRFGEMAPALQMYKEAGLTGYDLKQCDEADKAELSRILREVQAGADRQAKKMTSERAVPV